MSVVSVMRLFQVVPPLMDIVPLQVGTAVMEEGRVIIILGRRGLQNVRKSRFGSHVHVAASSMCYNLKGYVCRYSIIFLISIQSNSN